MSTVSEIELPKKRYSEMTNGTRGSFQSVVSNGLKTQSTVVSTANPSLNIQTQPQVTHKHTVRKRDFDEECIEEQARKLKANLKNADLKAASSSLLGLILAGVENELFYHNGNTSYGENHALRLLVMVTCLLSSIYIIKRYEIKLEILKRKKIVYKSTKLVRSPLIKSLVVELIIAWIFCPPSLDKAITNTQMGNTFKISLDSYIFFFMYAKLYLVVRLFDHFTVWTAPRATRVCKMNGFTADSTFAMKAYLTYRSFTMLAIGLSVSCLIFGLWLRLFERSYATSSRHQLSNLWNSFWCIIVTMATIGYGDIFPGTHLGRLVAIGACVWGVFILSMLVVILSSSTTMTKEENNAYEELVRDKDIQDKLRKEAAILIQAQYRLRLMRRSKDKSKSYMMDRFLKRVDLMGNVNRFRNKRRKVMSKPLTINNLIEGIYQKESEEAENLLRSLAPVKNIAEMVDTLESNQYQLNDRMVTIYENCKKIFSLAIEMSEGSLDQITDLSDIQNEYDFDGKRVGPKYNTNYAYEFESLKRDRVIDAYSPLLKAKNPLVLEKRGSPSKFESPNDRIKEEGSDEEADPEPEGPSNKASSRNSSNQGIERSP